MSALSYVVLAIVALFGVGCLFNGSLSWPARVAGAVALAGPLVIAFWRRA